MESLFEAVIALFAAIGIFSVLWILWGILQSPVVKKNEIYALIKISGNEPELEQVVNTFKWLGCLGGKNLNIIIADAGMDDETREIAKHLCDDQAVKICADLNILENMK